MKLFFEINKMIPYFYNSVKKILHCGKICVLNSTFNCMWEILFCDCKN